MNPLEAFGVRPVANGFGTNTRLSGAPLHPEVAEAMRAASSACFDVMDLQAAACREIAAAMGAEAGIATCGASAALLLGAAAIVAGLDAARMDRLPRLRSEFLIARSQRNMYDRAVELAGVRLVEVGIPDRFSGAGVRDAQPEEFAAAITGRTRGILYVAQPWSEPPLPALAEVARARNLPILVDAAAQLPPAANLRRFLEEGADLVCFSGGKAVGGPQASGILAGRRDLVTSALMQTLDLDMPRENFDPPMEFAEARSLAYLPRHGVGRSCKVGREEIAGLLVALRRFVAEGDPAREARWREALEGLPGQTVSHNGVPMRAVPADAALEARLRAAGVHLNTARLREGVLLVNPVALREGDAARIAALLS